MSSQSSVAPFLWGCYWIIHILFSLCCGFWGWAGYNYAPEDYVAIAFFLSLPLFSLLISLKMFRIPRSKIWLLPLGLLGAWELFMGYLTGCFLVEGPDLGTGSYTPSQADLHFAISMLLLTALIQGVKLSLIGRFMYCILFKNPKRNPLSP